MIPALCSSGRSPTERCSTRPVARRSCGPSSKPATHCCSTTVSSIAPRRRRRCRTSARHRVVVLHAVGLSPEARCRCCSDRRSADAVRLGDVKAAVPTPLTDRDGRGGDGYCCSRRHVANRDGEDREYGLRSDAGHRSLRRATTAIDELVVHMATIALEQRPLRSPPANDCDRGVAHGHADEQGGGRRCRHGTAGADVAVTRTARDAPIR